MAGWLDTVKLQAASQLASLSHAVHAVVTSVDAVAHAVKVELQPDGLESGWIPDSTLAAGSLRICCPSDIGTQVLVVPVEGDPEHPVVVARLFDVVQSPNVSPVTGKPVQAGEIGVFTSGDTYLHITSNGVFLGGTVTISGDLQVSGDVLAGQVSLAHHVHSAVAAGHASSGPPE